MQLIPEKNLYLFKLLNHNFQYVFVSHKPEYIEGKAVSFPPENQLAMLLFRFSRLRNPPFQIFFCQSKHSYQAYYYQHSYKGIEQKGGEALIHCFTYLLEPHVRLQFYKPKSP